MITVHYAAYRFTNADCHPSPASPTPAERASIRRDGMDGLVAQAPARYQQEKRGCSGSNGAILTQEANLARKIDSRSSRFGFDYCAAKRVLRDRRSRSSFFR